MRQTEFNQLFPKAETSRFKPDYDGTMVYINDDGVLVDVESSAFWDNLEYVKLLHLPPLGMRWWRESEASKTNKTNFLTEWRRVYKYRKLDHDDLFPLDYKPPPKKK